MVIEKMKRKISSFLLIKWVLIGFLYALLYGIFHYYALFRLNYDPSSLGFSICRMRTLLLINIVLIITLFIISKKVYVLLFILFTISGIYMWTYRYLLTQFGDYNLTMEVKTLVEFFLFLTYSIMAPGMILLLIAYIKKLTPRIHGNILNKKYHVHETFFGLILLGIGLIFMLIRGRLIIYEIFWEDLQIILGFFNVFVFVFLFFGAFFLFRDFHDLLKLKFIEKVKETRTNAEDNQNYTPIFGNITKNDTHFFQKPVLPLYPFGMLFTSVSFLMVIYGSDFLIYKLFFIPYNYVVNLGYILCFISAAIIGLDWFRLFKLFYPIRYKKINQKLAELIK